MRAAGGPAAPRWSPVSTVGAGDSTLAGWLSAERLPRGRAAAHRRGVGQGRGPAAGDRRCPGPNTSTSRPCAWSPIQIPHVHSRSCDMALPLITPELVALDLEADDRDAATRALIDLMVAAGRVTDADGFHADVRAREAQMATGMPGGIGLPHARSEHVVAPSLAVGPGARRRRLRRARRARHAHLPHRRAGGWRLRSPQDPRRAGPEPRPRVVPHVDPEADDAGAVADIVNREVVPS